MSMMRSVLVGTAAGAVGTAALNIVTYGDMALRGRPSSDVPSTLVKNLATSARIEPLTADDETGQNRRSGVAALLGYVDGLGVGVLYGAVRPVVRRRIPVALGALVAGAAAMAMSDVLAVRSGATDPKTWGASGWVADIVPHAIFGLAVALTFDVLDDGKRREAASRSVPLLEDVMELSARNQLTGRVTGVKTGAIMAEVAVDIEPAPVTATITRASVERLGLKDGDRVTVIIKSTEVMIGKQQQAAPS
jgi:molybdopterin-binding protein